jgi:hypothetical protein
VVEGRGALVDDAKLDLAAEVEGGHHGGGQHLDEEAVEGGEEVEVARRLEQLQEVVHGGAEAGVEQALLVVLAAVKRDRLGVLPHTHQPIPEVSLLCLLLEVEADQGAPDRHRQRSAAHSVDGEGGKERGVDGIQDAWTGGEGCSIMCRRDNGASGSLLMDHFDVLPA